MKKSILFLFIYLFGVSLLTFAQSPSLRMMSQTPLSRALDARCLLFDSYGMMWIGTEQGLLRYDGYSFHNYRSDAYSPGILSNNYVRTLTEDHDKGIWIGTHDGLVRYDMRTGQFRTYRLQGEQRRGINTLFTSNDGTVWVGTTIGVSCYDKQTDKFRNYDMPGGVMSFEEDAKGNILVGMWEQGLARLNRQTGKHELFPPVNKRNTVYSMLMDSQGRLWIGSWENGIQRIDNPSDTRQPQIHQFNNDRNDFRTFYRLVEDPVSHTLWGCCLEGFTGILTDNDKVVNYGQMLHFCNDIHADGQGNLWVLTQNDGIAHLSTLASPFHHYVLPASGQQLLVGCTRSVFTNDGRYFWLGLQPYGLARYDRQTDETLYGHRIPGFSHMTGADDVSLQTVSSMAQVGADVWFASTMGILVWQDGKPAELRSFRNTPYLNSDGVNALMRQRNGVVWVGQTSQVSLATSKTQGTTLTMKEGDDDFTVCNVLSFVEDSKGRVWIATDNEGIIRVSGDSRHPTQLQYHHYCPSNGNFAIDDATACYEDSHHRLWAISNSGGLFRYDEQADRFDPVNFDYHIMGGSVYSIEEDAAGALWLTTEHALVCLTFDDKGAPVITSYGNEEGLDDMRFSPNSSCRYANELFFGCQKGFFSFVPDKRLMAMSAKSPQLVVTNLRIDERSFELIGAELQRQILSTTPSMARKITIPSDIDKFTVEFSLLAYTHQEHIRYQYKLDGYDDEWRHVGMQQHSVTFQNLPAGNYKLHLKAVDNYGRWTELPYTIQIKVLPPWYLSWWAKLLYALLGALAIYGIVQWYKNYLKTKNRLAMGVVLTNITHELLTPLTVISASVDDMKLKAPQFDENYGLIQNNIHRITRLLRQILEVRKSQAGQLRLLVARDDLSAFVSKVCENIRPMAESKNSQLVVRCPQGGIDAWFDKDKVDKIIYNLLSNAVKYNREHGRITLELSASGKEACLKVSDEGIGISKDKMKHLYSRFLDGDYRRMNTFGTGIGLSLTHDLTILHHGTIDCQSEENVGTTFTVRFPIDKANYKESEIDVTADNRRQSKVLEDHIDIDSEHLEATESPSGQHDYSMLIVEDNTELLELMERLLSPHYNIYTARNGQVALNIIHHHDLDIVVTDVMMPVMDGMELTRAIKNSPDYGQLPVVMLTAKTSEEDFMTGFETGADAYITKPFKLDALQLRIENIIQNRERIRRKFVSQTDFKVEEQHYSSPDEVFIQKCVDIVKQHLDDSDFDREQFASAMCVSSSTLYNRLRALTGQNVTGFINSIRLKEACRILRQQPDIRINELSLEVGFNTPKYFTKCFKKEFGMLPKEYLEQS
ncbi:MAG: response regulator [Prevotella sp.]|nr:response regulator [Prevotella sp.]